MDSFLNENITTQEMIGTTQEIGTNDEGTTQEKIIDIIKNNHRITSKELMHILGITSDGVKYHLDRLKKCGRLIRKGSTKSGEWLIIDK